MRLEVCDLDSLIKIKIYLSITLFVSCVSSNAKCNDRHQINPTERDHLNSACLKISGRFLKSTIKEGESIRPVIMFRNLCKTAIHIAVPSGGSFQGWISPLARLSVRKKHLDKWVKVDLTISQCMTFEKQKGPLELLYPNSVWLAPMESIEISLLHRTITQGELSFTNGIYSAEFIYLSGEQRRKKCFPPNIKFRKYYNTTWRGHLTIDLGEFTVIKQ